MNPASSSLTARVDALARTGRFEFLNRWLNRSMKALETEDEMGSGSQSQRLEGAHALHRYSHRVPITDDTDSRAACSRVNARKPRYRKGLRVATPTPRPAAEAAGKFNSSTTFLRILA